jgi:hypothetical protein
MLRLFLPEGSPDGLARLSAGLPGAVLTPLGLDVPLTDFGPEEILALCVRCGVTARATAIVTRQAPG